jgi:membrane-associated protein
VITDLLDSLGGMSTPGLCLVVFLLAYGESALFMDLIVPGEVGLAVAGAAAANGGHAVAPLILAGALGALAGDTTGYAVGRRWGRSVIERFDLTRRRLCPLVDTAHEHFEAHGGRSVFVARWVGALRAVVPFVAGVAKMPYRKLLLWDAPAALLWSTAVIIAGFVFGRRISEVIERIGFVVSGGVVLLLIVLWRWRRSRSSSKGTDSD